MEGLDDAYGPRWEGRDPRRVVAGAVLFGVGVLTVLAAIVVATGWLNGVLATGTVAAQGLAGVLAGVAIPAMMVGVVLVLPTDRRERVGVLAGAGFCLVGVWLFTLAYPDQWTGAPNSLAFPTTLTYFVGGCVAFWFVFVAVADYRVRNNPADDVRLRIMRDGQTREVQVSRDEYRRYQEAIRGDGGQTEQVIEELESRFER